MQSKGAIKFFAIMLAIACAFQLSFTFIAGSVTSKADNLPAEQSQSYLDSMKNEVVYDLGFVEYTYGECLEREINLGLDLRGGMNVTLQIAVEDIVTALAEDNAKQPQFVEAMALAKVKQQNSQDDFIDLFEEAYLEINPQIQFASIFANYNLRERINATSTNQEVITVLKDQCDGAIANSFNVLSNRIDRFGVTQPNIQKLGNSGRILVELPGVKDPDRVRKLLQGTASLEFWSVYKASDIVSSMVAANTVVANLENAKAALNAPQEEVVEEAEVVEGEGSIVDEIASSESVVDAAAGSMGLFKYLQPSEGNTPVVGMAHSYDTVAINKYLARNDVKSLFPSDVKFMWGVKAIENSASVFELYAIKGGMDGVAPLDGGSVTDAVGEYGQSGSRAEVSMTMDGEGARTWARLTGDNVGGFIAIVLDNCVYSCPGVNEEITGGRSQITGNFTINEAKDLANVLKSGKLPAPARIIQESVVGPTLGQESINAGVGSFIIAFILVLLYMIFFYSRAGLVASVALIANLFFLLGVLVSFGAVLTLPGIAGIVLTMGMAVDANVIIYERIKEELKAGKGYVLSVADGFRHAYSAIIDGNATTLITGIILFTFGSGSVQGFATTLIIGILTSLFTSIFITRLIFEGIAKRGKSASFSTSLTKNFLTGTKVNFIKCRKVTYVISAILIVLSLGSLATRGFEYGVDFSGGRTYVVRFDQEVTANEVRAGLGEVFTSSIEVKQFGAASEKQMRITTQYKIEDDGEAVTEEINSMMYEALSPLYAGGISFEEFTATESNPLGVISAEKVGPTIADEMKVNAFWAIIISLCVIGLYIAARFRKWQYGIGGVVSLIHDAVITMGMFSLLYSIMPFNLTVDQAFIAAILTIVGYSINDTVVIFDRIRENVNVFQKRTLRDNMNNALNQTLARTVNTAGSTIVVLLAMFIFGGDVIRGFIFALLFGVIIGTYSSLFVATPIAFDLITKDGKKKAAAKSKK